MTSPASPSSYPPPNEQELRALRLWVLLARAYNSVAALVHGDITGRGLTVGEFAVLEALYHKGMLLQGEIQQKILVSSGGVTYLIDRLVDRGLVERVDCPEDRRARYARLTDAGSSLIASIFPSHRDAVTRAVAGLGEEEQLAAAALLRKLGLAAAETGQG